MRTEINLTQADISIAITDYLSKTRNMEVMGTKLTFNLQIEDKLYQDVSNVTALVTHDEELIAEARRKQHEQYVSRFTSR